MQNVSFLIKPNDRIPWLAVTKKIEELGYEVSAELQDSKTTIVLGGSYMNPMVLNGRKVLIAFPLEELKAGWNTIFMPVLVEYYDRIEDVRKMSVDKIMDIIRGEIEVTESGSQD
jgi:hypothetical protein